MNNFTPHFPENITDYAPWVTKHGLRAPYGTCQCGCGQAVALAQYSYEARGYTRDQPVRFVTGHHGRRYPIPSAPNPDGLCQCGCGGSTTIATENRALQGHAKGEPVRFIAGHQFRRGTLEERFWQKVIKRGQDECWGWSGTRSSDGYGRINPVHGYMVGAHRVSYELHYGPIPSGMLVLHRCDNPPCTNPAHLFLGDNAANARDKIAKGRSNIPVGERHHMAKLTNEQAREARQRYASGEYNQRELAYIYGVTKAAMRRIVRGLSYQNA